MRKRDGYRQKYMTRLQCRICADQFTIWSAVFVSLIYPLLRNVAVVLCAHLYILCTLHTLYTLHILHTLCTLLGSFFLSSDHRPEHDKGGGHHWDHETGDHDGSSTKCGRMLLKQVQSKQVAVAFVHLRLASNTLPSLRSRRRG